MALVLDAVIFPGSGRYGTYFGVLSGIASLALFLPNLAVGVRRLHDTDRSGWWVLISVIPIIGWIVLLVFLVSSGTPGGNRFGPPPAGTRALPDTDFRPQPQKQRESLRISDVAVDPPDRITAARMPTASTGGRRRAGANELSLLT